MEFLVHWTDLTVNELVLATARRVVARGCLLADTTENLLFWVGCRPPRDGRASVE